MLKKITKWGALCQAYGLHPLCLILRLSCGWLFVRSGWGKLQHLPQIIAYFESLHVDHAAQVAPMTATIELVGGTLLMVGLLTRPAAAALVGIMGGAIVSARLGDITDVVDLFGLQEWLLGLILAVLVVLGAGRASLDHLLRR